MTYNFPLARARCCCLVSHLKRRLKISLKEKKRCSSDQLIWNSLSLRGNFYREKIENQQVNRIGINLYHGEDQISGKGQQVSKFQIESCTKILSTPNPSYGKKIIVVDHVTRPKPEIIKTRIHRKSLYFKEVVEKWSTITCLISFLNFTIYG